MDKNKYQTLQEWHELLKSGIITEEDFNKKKRELIGDIESTSQKEQPDLSIETSIKEVPEQEQERNPNDWLNKNKRWLISLIIVILIGIITFIWHFPSKEKSDFNKETETVVNKNDISNRDYQMGNSYFNTIVQEWNKAHLSKDVGVFHNLFDDTVLFYGTQMDKSSCIESKLSLFKKNPDFYQQIYGDVQIENISETEVKCSFIKKVTVNQVTKDYSSYLTLKKTGTDWKIITEGDLVTDKNLAKKGKTKTVAVNQENYHFEPTESVISGTIKIETFFGPPGFGENPETDRRDNSYILNLDNPINVISKDKDDDFNRTTYNVSKIHLTASDAKLTNYKNKFVRLTGTFFSADNGNHHTDVLMFVTKIE